MTKLITENLKRIALFLLLFTLLSAHSAFADTTPPTGSIAINSGMAYTIFEDRETVFSAIKAGASGYILKGSSPRELVESLNSLFHGGA